MPAKSYIPYILLLVAVCFLSLLGTQRVKEAFQSAGTLLQLETSHVPTIAEVRDTLASENCPMQEFEPRLCRGDRQHWLRQRVREDMLYLNGSL
jgi:hypothetical protein